MEQFVLLIGAIGALLGAGGIAALLKTRSDNKKTDAETELTLTDGWRVLWETSRTEVNELRERLVLVEQSDKECKTRLAKLESVGSAEVEKRVSSMIQAEIEKREGANVG